MNLFEKYKDFNNFELRQAFYESCSKNKVVYVKHLIENKNYNINISLDDYFGFRAACTHGSLDVLKYLFSNKESIPDIHSRNDSAFKSATRMQQFDIIQFLIFDLNIPKTEAINQFLLKNPNKIIDSMFNARELNRQLKLEFDFLPIKKGFKY